MYSLLLTTTLAAALLAGGAVGAADFPEGYRHWSHVKTLTLLADHPLEDPFRGIHHVYANGAALEGLRTGNYPDGAILVFDLLEAVTADHATAEGARILVGVMQKDSARQDTGGWQFDAWPGDTRAESLVNDDGRSCYACHASEKDSAYVFSRWRD